MNTLKNKNLLIISNGFPNKKESIDCTFVKSQVDQLSKYFKEIHVIVPTPYFPKWVKYLGIKGYDNRLNNSNYSYNNISVYYTKYFKLPNKISYKTFNLFNSILNTIKKEKIKFDLIHSHFIFPSGLVGVELKKRTNKKLIVTGHGFDVYDFPFKNKSNLLIFKKVLRSCDFFITVSNNNLKIAKSIVNLDKKSEVINNFYDLKFKPRNRNYCRQKLRLPKNKKIILHVGSYNINIKNQITLIKSINLLKDKRKDFVLYLIGQGSDELKIKNKINELKLNKYVKLLGPKKHDDLPYWMSSADLFVLPSYFEGNPTVMFESLACGVPFIGTNVGGVKDIINNKKFGFVLENPLDYNQLSILIDNGLNCSWNYKSIIRYSEKYSLEKISVDLLKKYNLIFYE